jgi:hypothetical protein
MLRLLAAGAALLTLSACTTGGVGIPGYSPLWFMTATPQEQTAYFGKKCQAYGFQPGTAAMAQCIQNESLSAQSRATRRASRHSTTTCSGVGNTATCTTF